MDQVKFVEDNLEGIWSKFEGIWSEYFVPYILKARNKDASIKFKLSFELIINTEK